MSWMIITDRPILSGVLLVALLVALLYFARHPVHLAVYRTSRLAISMLRLQAKAVLKMIAGLKQRNRDVLLEMGKRQLERELNRDFHHVNEIVASDLSNYPSLQRSISELITKLEEDYHKSAETPPPSPDWIEAIESIVSLKEAQKGNLVIVKVLEDLYSSLEAQQKKTLDTYRSGVSTRHRLLHSMMPHWRKLNNAVERVGDSLKNLIIQSEEIDQKMDQYREIQAGTEKAERFLQVSALNDFVKSLFFMAFLVGGAFLNFHLIALPMSEMVGSGARIGNFTIAEISGLMMIVLEMTTGMFLMEVLQITRLFPAFGTLDERKRRILIWTFLGLIIVFSTVEAGLAFMRDQIANDNAALTALLIGGEAVNAQASSTISQFIPQAAQMLLGFFLPFILMFVAVPFEWFVESSRIIAGNLLVQILHVVVILLRLVAAIVRYGCDILISLYDIVISLPIWIESKLTRHPNTKKETAKPSALEDVL